MNCPPPVTAASYSRHKAGRSDAPVDTWAESLLAEGRQQEAWAVLPYASAVLAKRFFPQVLDEGGWAGTPAWTRGPPTP